MPNFLVIGAMKAGTTSLASYLRDHPQVYVPPAKELHFFVEALNWSRGLAWYEEQFAEAGNAAAIGEASPSYTAATAYRGVPERIAATLPGARLVYVLRHPIERMRSHYLHQVVLGEEDRPIEVAFAEDEPYLNMSRYRWQIDQYLQRFGSDQLLVITAEQLRHDREATVRRVLRFLEVDDEILPGSIDRERHATASKRVASGARARLDRVPLVAALGRRAPARVRRWADRVTTRAVEAVPVDLSPAVEETIRAKLADDVAGLRELLGAGFDGWDWPATAPEGSLRDG